MTTPATPARSNCIALMLILVALIALVGGGSIAHGIYVALYSVGDKLSILAGGAR